MTCVRPDQRGFSLLELLVAMTILGMVGAAIAGAVRFGVMTFERGGTHMAALEQLHSVELALRNQFEALPLQLVRGADKKAVAVFSGQANAVQFLFSPPASARPAQEVLATLEARHGNILTLDLGAGDGQPRVLMHNLQSATFSYFGPSKPNAPSIWQDSWSQRARLPDMIEVTLQPAQDADWVQHRFVIALHTQSSRSL
ncbi:MAG: prepilin-type N-terminal cleavage/methylation domain-containing protein [Pseudomonadota bacterium]